MAPKGEGMAPVQVRGVVLGAGKPKICVPLVASGLEALIVQARAAMAAQADIIEWRADHFADVLGAAGALALEALRGELGQVPLLFTYRSRAEGGVGEADEAALCALCERAVRSGCVDVLDIEASRGAAFCAQLRDVAMRAGVRTIFSYHNFKETPSEGAIFDQLATLQECGGDMAKVAYMPNDAADALALMCAAQKFGAQGAKRPYIAISMGKEGAISRAGCALIGSCLTFATVGAMSAPGQLEIETLRVMLRELGGDERPKGGG